MHQHRGFTLIELLIVITIILIIAAITIPSLTYFKIHADETSAVASLRAIQTAQTLYQTKYLSHGYASSLAELGGPEDCKPSPAAACLLDETLTQGTKSGYTFSIVGGQAVDGANTTYVASAVPVAYNRTGVKRFCTTDKNVVRFDTNTAGGTTPPTAEECKRFEALR